MFQADDDCLSIGSAELPVLDVTGIPITLIFQWEREAAAFCWRRKIWVNNVHKYNYFVAETTYSDRYLLVVHEFDNANNQWKHGIVEEERIVPRPQWFADAEARLIALGYP